MIFTGLENYDQQEGYGTATGADLQELHKALSAGQDVNAPAPVTPGDGFALRVESLEKTLKNVTYKMENIRFWRGIPKIQAYNTVEEHNVISSYGENPDSTWVSEGDLPESDDSTYERKYAVVKYMGTTRRVTHQMTLVRPAHGDVISQETVSGAMHLLRSVETGLFFGDSGLSSLQWDGFEKLISDGASASNVIDLRGKPLSEDILTDAALTIADAPNYGTPTHLHLNPKVKADLAKTFFPKSRYDTFNKTDSGLVGLDMRGFTSPAGDVMFESNVFITDGGAPNMTALGDASKIPASPTVTTPLAAAPAVGSLFEVADEGDYIYRVAAVNRYGRSASISAGAAITVAAGDGVTVGITPGGGGAVEWYAVYRSKPDGTDLRLIKRIPNGAGVGEETITDLNEDLPFTTKGFMLQQNLESLSFKLLAPMVKVPLSIIDASVRWMQLLYGVPVLYAPNKNVLFKNIGRASNFVGTP